MNSRICKKCELPKFFGPTGYAGPQCRCFISSELREDCGPVFLSEYPDEGDVIGWLKVHRDNDPLGMFSGRWADDAVKKIEQLRTERDVLIAALEYHQEQTRPIQKTIEALERVKAK